jgi:hypothetical protein
LDVAVRRFLFYSDRFALKAKAFSRPTRVSFYIGKFSSVNERDIFVFAVVVCGEMRLLLENVMLVNTTAPDSKNRWREINVTAPEMDRRWWMMSMADMMREHANQPLCVLIASA